MHLETSLIETSAFDSSNFSRQLSRNWTPSTFKISTVYDLNFVVCPADEGLKAQSPLHCKCAVMVIVRAQVQ